MPSFKKYMVHTKRNGDVYHPSTIPKERDLTAVYNTTSFFLVLCFVALWLSVDNFGTAVGVASYGLLTLVLVEILQRVVLFLNELNYIKARYEDSYKRLLNAFYFSRNHITFIIIVVGVCLTCYAQQGLTVFKKLNPIGIMPLSALIILFGKLLKLEQAPIYDSLTLSRDNGLSYGAHMAHCFFYGYLRLILPKLSEDDGNMFEKIQTYKDREGVQFAVAKFFILIPKSCFCHDSLQNEHFPDIEESSSLGEMKLTLAGVQERIYKQAVYKVIDRRNNRRHYICVEYATPLRTFKKAFKSHFQYSENLRKQKAEIVLKFYLVLKKLLESDTEISHLCELIYYDDRENNKYVDVAGILLSKVRLCQR